MSTPTDRREPLVGRPWVQVVALVTLMGLFVLVLMGWLDYQSHPPIPERVLTTSGRTVLTGADIRAGQEVFLRNGRAICAALDVGDHQDAIVCSYAARYASSY